MDYSHKLDELVREMADTMSVRQIRDRLHACVDESCDQLNLDAVDAKYDAEEA